MKNKLSFLLALICLIGISCNNRQKETKPETKEEYQARMKWWHDARFGMFIHWGPVSLVGTEISWSRKGERKGVGGTGEIPVEIYDNLYKKFNPVQFNADEWVRIAQEAGMKHMVFTTKHHDGFCEFDTKLTDYKITSKESPYGKDIVKQLADAAHKAGMPIGFYYSPVDWHFPDFRTANHKKYIEYMHGQIEELLTNYGKVSVLWFDGLGGTKEDWDAENLFKKIKKLQPDIIINNRCGLDADFGTPEQEIGTFDDNKFWESCITIGDQWAWKPNDNIKSAKASLQTLIITAGNDGNLLYNVGPMPDGRIEPRQVTVLKAMGDWLGKYGESIYNTHGGPFISTLRYTSTRKNNKIYLHVLEWDDEETLTLPGISKKIVKASLLTGGELTFNQSSEKITIKVDKKYHQDINTLILLELDGSAMDIKALPNDLMYLGCCKPAKASSVYGKQDNYYGAAKAVDGNISTVWVASKDSVKVNLEVNLEKECSFDRALLSEYTSKKVKKFNLQAKLDGKWKTFYEGTNIRERLIAKFKPVKTQYVRLNILEASDKPISIAEFEVYKSE